MDSQSKWFRIIALLLLVYIFLVGISMLGIFFKSLGQEFAAQLLGTVSIPLIALFVGVLATSVMQSSSATTSILVGLVATGILDLTTAIPMIMGANIGTSITSTLTALGHITDRVEFSRAFSGAVLHDFFNIFAIAVLFPIEMVFHPIETSVLALTGLFVGVESISFISPVSILVKPVATLITDMLIFSPILILLIALVFLFGALKLIVTDMRPFVVEEVQHMLNSHFFRNHPRSFATGIGLTVLVQSSSITTSLVIPFVGTGTLSLKKIFPYVVGANIGTTITGFLAALAIGTPLALSAALAHLIFNIFAIAIFVPLRRVPMFFAETMGKAVKRYRRIAIGYTATFFFIIPGIVIFLAR